MMDGAPEAMNTEDFPDPAAMSGRILTNAEKRIKECDGILIFQLPALGYQVRIITNNSLSYCGFLSKTRVLKLQ
jgi:hypothetical protein